MITNKITKKWLDIGLFTAVAFSLIAVGVMLFWNIHTQFTNYAVAIDSALDGERKIDLSAVIAYTRSWDFAIIKTSSLFISVIIILIGLMYVLRSSESSFKISSQSDWFKGAFTTSSPGRATILMGVALVALSLNYKSDVGYESTTKKTFDFEQEATDQVALREYFDTMEIQ